MKTSILLLLLLACGNTEQPIYNINKPESANENSNKITVRVDLKKDATPSLIRKDTFRYIEVNFEGHKIPVRLPYKTGKQQFSPCTYLLLDGAIVYGECGGLYHTPHKGKERLRIQCVAPDKLYYELFSDAVSYSPAPFMPAVSLEARPIPYRIEYYDAAYSHLVSAFDLRADNPYTKEKMPQIEIEQFYEGEMGFGYPREEDEDVIFWTYAWPFFFDNRYTGITYRLQRYTSNRALTGMTTTLAVLDTIGNEIFRLNNLKADIVPTLITRNGKYLFTYLNKEIDMQGYPNRLDNPGIRIYNINTKEVIYEDLADSVYGYFEGPSQDQLSALVFYSKRENINDDANTTYVLLDMESKVKYERIFSKTEREDISMGAISWAVSWEAIMAKYSFSANKF